MTAQRRFADNVCGTAHALKQCGHRRVEVVIDAPPTVAFSKRWIAKAVQYDSGSLEDAFDRYFSLFVAFNRLYSYVNRHAAQPADGDRKQATSGFLTALGAPRLVQAIEGGGGTVDIEVMRDLIAPESGEFFLIFNQAQGMRDAAKNDQLFNDLGAKSSTTRVSAVLRYLYFVRCNMFHGAKDFEHRQLTIIEPATRVLERVVNAALEFVEANPSTSRSEDQ